MKKFLSSSEHCPIDIKQQIVTQKGRSNVSLKIQWHNLRIFRLDKTCALSVLNRFKNYLLKVKKYKKYKKYAVCLFIYIYIYIYEMVRVYFIKLLQ